MLVARQNFTSSVFPNFCFLLCPQQKKFYYVDTYTYLEDSGVNILWENPDSWGQKLVGEHFPLLLFVSWVKAFEVCSIYGLSDGACVGQSPGIPSGTQLSNAPLSWLSLIPVSPIQSHGVGDVQKCTQVFPIGAFKLPTSPHILHRSGGQA